MYLLKTFKTRFFFVSKFFILLTFVRITILLLHPAPEAAKTKANRFILDFCYPDWIANLVLVPKPNRTWRTYINYSDLNKACLKEYFHFPMIDQMVDTTSAYELFSFIDAYSRYNQISMHVTD